MSRLLDALDTLLLQYQPLLLVLISASVLMLIVSLVAVPWLVLRLPPDYYAKSIPPTRLEALPATLRMPLLALKNGIGSVLLLAGIAMLFLPGQGLVTILLGLALVDFPGKRRAERWLVSRPPVFASLNWIRRRGGRPPLHPVPRGRALS